MSWSAVRRHIPILGLVTACAVVIPPSSAWADGLIGKHFFPSTLAIDDPFIADELGFTLLHIKAQGRGQSPPTLTTATDAVYAKRLTESLGLPVGGRLLHLDPDDRSSQTAFDNATVEVKYEIAESAEHEALLSAALGWKIGGTGDTSVGAPSFDVVVPAVFLAKGFGDLPEVLLFARPFALTGRLGARIPTRGSSRAFDPSLATRTAHENPNVLEWGVAMEYSLPYLQDVVRGVALPPPFSRIVPLVEFSLATPWTERIGAGRSAR